MVLCSCSLKIRSGENPVLRNELRLVAYFMGPKNSINSMKREVFNKQLGVDLSP
jgi:hypothetical protein